MKSAFCTVAIMLGAAPAALADVEWIAEGYQNEIRIGVYASAGVLDRKEATFCSPCTDTRYYPKGSILLRNLADVTEQQMAKSTFTDNAKRTLTLDVGATQKTSFSSNSIRSSGTGRSVRQGLPKPADRAITRSSGLIYFKVLGGPNRYVLNANMNWSGDGGAGARGVLRLYGTPNTGSNGDGFSYTSYQVPKVFPIPPKTGVLSAGIYSLEWYVLTDAMGADANADYSFDMRFMPITCETERKDTDGDGLCDAWETAGVTIDNGKLVPIADVYDSNGNGSLDADEKPDPDFKDVFVEVDWIPGNKPDPRALQLVIDAFARAPVANPNGRKDGIKLHVALSDEATEIGSAHITPFMAADEVALDASASFNAVKKRYFGPKSARVAGSGAVVNDAARIRAQNIIEARRKVFRYALFTNQFDPYFTPGSSEMGGDDFVIAMAPIRATPLASVRLYREAITFMHELGHTLGLHHGGRDDVNCKANYLSVMNYSRSSGDAVDVHALDYSRFELPSLDTFQLDEKAGLLPGITPGSAEWKTWQERLASYFTLYGPRRKVLVAGKEEMWPKYERAVGPKDWNANETIDPKSVFAPDIDQLSTHKDGESISACEGSKARQMFGHDDWANLDYNFRDSPSYGPGVVRPQPEPVGFLEYTK